MHTPTKSVIGMAPIFELTDNLFSLFQPTLRPVKNTNLLVGTLVRSAYAAQLSPPTVKLLSRLPATLDKVFMHTHNQTNRILLRKCDISRTSVCLWVGTPHTLHSCRRPLSSCSLVCPPHSIEHTMRYLTCQLFCLHTSWPMRCRVTRKQKAKSNCF